MNESPVPRCCPAHHDWSNLAQHLLADFDDVPNRAIVDELAQAKRASEFFHLDQADALECVELIVRHRVLSATDPMSGTAPLQRLAVIFPQVA